MSLINCLQKINSFSNEEQEFILNKAIALRDKYNINQKEAEIRAVNELQEDLMSSLKDIHKQLDIISTKEVKTFKGYDASKGLLPMRLVYKKDKIKLEQEEYDKLSTKEKEEYKQVIAPAQVFLSWNIRDKKGKLLDQKDFIDPETGYLSTEKLPKEILTQFGFRIPNQGHNSMSLIEVVGFLPDIYAGVVITSRNFVTQMGSDFDVDKLYIYNYNTEVDENGRVTKQKDNVQNDLVDIHKSVLYNKDVFDSVVKPLDLGSLSYKTKSGQTKGIAEELKKEQKKPVLNYLAPTYDTNKYLESVDGKAMIGITSSANVFSTLLQDKGIYIQEIIKKKPQKARIIIGMEEGETIELSDISSAFTISGRSKNQEHQSAQSASVDNGNNPLLKYVNVNAMTASVLTMLIDLGSEGEYNYNFLAQPVLVKYSNKAKQGKSSLSNRVTEERILDKLQEDYKSTLNELYVKLKIKDLADFPLQPKHLKQTLYKTAAKTEFTDKEIQALVLAKFIKIKKWGDPLQKLGNIFNIESKGVGKGLLVLSDKRSKIDQALEDHLFANMHKIVGELEQGEVIPNTITGHAIVNGIFAADDTLTNSNLMPFSLVAFEDLLNQYTEITADKNISELSADQKYEVWKAVKSFVYAKFFDKAERERIFFDRNSNKSLNTRIHNLLKTKLKNNRFILRLDLSKVDITGIKPSEIFYNSSKEVDIEENNIYQDLHELVYSNDPELAEIGKDLIKYFYINGGSTSAKDWGRYISAEMLDTIGLTEFVKTINFSDPETYGKKEEVSDVLLQLFQHKPYLAQKLISDTGFTLKNGELTIEKGDTPIELIRGLNVTPVLSYKRRTFRYIGRDTEGNYIYKILPKLGERAYSEYYQPEVNENEDKWREKTMPSDPSLQSYENPLVAEQFKDLLDVTVGEALNSIQSNKYNKQISNLFNKLSDIIGEVKIEATESDELYFGRWDQRTVKINLKKLKERGRLNRKTVEEEILKELVHVLNTKLFKQSFTPTGEQIEARAAITTLFTSIRDRILSGELVQWDKATLIKYEEILKRLREGKPVNEEDTKFLLDNKSKYYGLTNVEDFLHEALLQDEFREALNSVKYDSNKSLLDRISDLILEILDGFRELVGIEKGSALEEAFVNLIKLTEKVTNPQTTQEDQFNSNETQDDIFWDISESKIKKEEEKNYQGIIYDYGLREKRISEAIANAANQPTLKTTLENRLKEVKAEKAALIGENTLDTLVKYANNDFKYINSILANPVISASELNYMELVLGTWTNIDDIDRYKILTSLGKQEGTPKALLIKGVANTARDLKDRLKEAKLRIGANLIGETLSREVIREDLTLLSDIGSAQASFRDISTSDNVTLNAVDYWNRQAEFEAGTEITALIKKVEELEERLKNLGVKSREDFQEKFGQINEKGEYTGDIVSALNWSYYAIRDQLLENLADSPNEGERKKNAETYYNWIRDNHIIIDTLKLYREDNNGLFIEEPNQAYLDTLKEELGDDYEEAIKYAKKVTEEYNTELRNQLEYYKGKENEGMLLDIWRLENSPVIYLDNLINGLTIRKVNGYAGIRSDGKKTDVVYNHGWKYISKRVKSSWEDTKYNEIQKDSALKEFYDWYTDTMQELNQYLPYNIRKDLKSTDIANISKTLIQELHDVGGGKMINRIKSSFLEALSVAKNERHGLINPATGLEEKEFTFKYLDRIDPNNKSYHLIQAIKLFGVQAIMYKYKAKIEDNVRLAQSILEDSLEQQRKSNGELVKDKHGRTTTLKGLENLRKQLDYFIDASIYGNKKDKKEGRTEKEFITPKDKELRDKELAEVQELEITEASKQAKIAVINNKYARVYSWSRIGDTLLGYVQLKGMGWNVLGGVNNAAFGQIANLQWASAGTDFSDKDMYKAIATMLAAQSPTIGVNKEISEKVEALMIKFDTVKQLRDRIYNLTTNYNKVRKGIKKLSPYELYAQGEYFVQGQVMVALLEAQKVKVIENGEEKEISLFEAFNKEGNWDTKRFGESKEWGETLGKKTLNFKLKLDDLLTKIHGNYDPKAAILINKKFFGRAIIQFRRWIPEGVAQRFDSEKYNNKLQRLTKGRYNTYYDLGWKDSLVTLMKLALHKDSAFDDLGIEGEKLEIVKENMKRNLREIYFKLSLMGMYLLISGLDDDDDWTRLAKNYTLNTILRLQDDIEFYYSPMAFDNITRSAMPVFNLVQDFYRFGDAVTDTLTGDGEYLSGKHAHQSKLLWRGAKVLPFSSSVASLIAKGQTQETFRK